MTFSGYFVASNILLKINPALNSILLGASNSIENMNLLNKGIQLVHIQPQSDDDLFKLLPSNVGSCSACGLLNSLELPIVISTQVLL